VELASEVRLRDLLAHLYVLLPVLDDDKHYWVGDDEVDKLLRYGEGWLNNHPQRDLISRRYLKHQRDLWRQALAQLLDAGQADPSVTTVRYGQEEEQLEAPIKLGEQRIQAVLDTLRSLGSTRVVDLGCGEGRLISELLREPAIRSITGVDVSHRALETARERLHLDTMPNQQRERINLLHGSLTYRDKRLSGFDAAIAMEVIEHIDPPRLDAFEEVVFGSAKPGAALITTPNAEYNALFKGLPAGEFRHRDHRFEWTREQFQAWSRGVANRRGYEVRFDNIGPEHDTLGSPTQLGVFTR
jgi:3' terminal RNA ribose 2'-O-methyltransferase Hen1